MDQLDSTRAHDVPVGSPVTPVTPTRCPVCHRDNPAEAVRCAGCGEGLAAYAKPGTVIGGRYEILSLLGRGGMGVVYSARDKALDEVVALKLLRADAIGSTEMERRLRSEIKLARRVSHPNVCRIHEYGEEGSLIYISMELVEGSDLKQILRSRGPLPHAEAFDIAIQVAEGLQAIHKTGIVHRDLKTPNLICDREGRVRVMDFGLAKRFGPEATTGLTGTGLIVGTPEYMSPEQARGHAVDSRSDIYALGIVIFELFTGQVPFRGETPIATILKHIQDAPPLDGQAAGKALPPSVLPLLRRALAKDPDERHSNAAELAEELRQARDRAVGSESKAPPAKAIVPTSSGQWPTVPVRRATPPAPPVLEPKASRSPLATERHPVAPRERSRPTPRPTNRLALVAGLTAAMATVVAGGFAITRRGSGPLPDGAPSAVTLAANAMPPVAGGGASSAASSPAPGGAAPSAPMVEPAKPPAAANAGPGVTLAGASPRPRVKALPTATPRPLESTPPSAETEPLDPQMPIGTPLVVRITGQIRSDRSRPGQEFGAVLEEALQVDGRTLAPRGTAMRGRLETAGVLPGSPGRPFMEVSLFELQLDGRPVPLRTAYYRLVAPQAGGSDVRAIAIGAVVGAALGAAVDGGDGAVKGAVAGGLVGSALGRSPGSPVYSFGDRLTFKLAEELPVRAASR